MFGAGIFFFFTVFLVCLHLNPLVFFEKVKILPPGFWVKKFVLTF